MSDLIILQWWRPCIKINFCCKSNHEKFSLLVIMSCSSKINRDIFFFTWCQLLVLRALQIYFRSWCVQMVFCFLGRLCEQVVYSIGPNWQIHASLSQMFLVRDSSFSWQVLLLWRTLLWVSYQYVQGFQQNYLSACVQAQGENCFQGLSRR